MLIIPDNEGNELLQKTDKSLSPTTGDKIGASMTQMFVENPVASMLRFNELSREKGEFGIFNEPGSLLSLFTTAPEHPAFRTKKLSKKLTQEEWKKSEHFRTGLKFPNGVRENVARIIAERKDEERARQIAIQNGPDDLLTNSGAIAGSLLAAMMDPVNVASAFIPVVGEARFAYLTTKLGLTGARAARGVTEGAFGAAVVEPIVLTAAQQEQADYGVFNSFMNVVFGSILGGGLHSVGGKVVDVLRGRTPEMVMAEMRSVIAQGMSGYKPDVGPFFRAIDSVETHPVHGTRTPSISRAGKLESVKSLFDNQAGFETNLDEVVDSINVIRNKKTTDLTPQDKEILKELKSDPDLQRLSDIAKKPEESRTTQDLDHIRSFDKSRLNNKEGLKAEAKGELNRVNKELATKKKSKPKTPASKKARDTRIKNLETQKKELEQRIDDIENDRILDKPPKYRDIDELKQDVEKTFKPDNDSAYDADSIRQVDKVANKEDYNINQDLDEIGDQIQNLADNGLITKKQLAAYNELNQPIKEADKTKGILDALAVCIAR